MQLSAELASRSKSLQRRLEAVEAASSGQAAAAPTAEGPAAHYLPLSKKETAAAGGDDLRREVGRIGGALAAVEESLAEAVLLIGTINRHYQ